MCERHAQHPATGRVAERHKIQETVTAERGACGLVGKVRDLGPLSSWTGYVMRDFAAVAVVDGREVIASIGGRRCEDLGDARKVFPQRIAVRAVGRAKFVEVQLLVEMDIRVRPLAGVRVARVVKPAVAAPGHAAEGGGKLKVRDGIAELAPGGKIEDVQRA